MGNVLSLPIFLNQKGLLMKISLSTPIIKPVNFACNLSCSYCYTKGINDHRSENFKIMSNSTLGRVINFFCSEREYTEFIWHGGEPLLAGLNFYEEAIRYQLPWIRKGKKIANSIQSNGTLLDEKWVDFFRTNNFRVGVSIDGIPEHHNEMRKYKDGTGSFNDVMMGIKLLQEADIFSGIICCVNTYNHRFPIETLNFFVSNGIKKLKFNRIRGKLNKVRVPDGSISFEKYVTFLLSVLDYWIKIDDTELEIRELQCIIELMLGGITRDCVISGECHKYCTVYSDGSIYSCDSFPKREDLRFGTVIDTPEEIKTSITFQKFLTLSNAMRNQCDTCEWYNICRGGCLQDWHLDTSDNSYKNTYCKDQKKLFEAIRLILTAYDLI